ncbi:MAG: DUF721 domain-containing protein [Gemmatimonadota bacterium]
MRRRVGKGSQPRPLADALPAVLDGLGLVPGLEDARLFEHWEAAVGIEIARVSKPHRIDADTLIVHVKHSAWMNELSLRRIEILQRINARRPRRKVARLILRIEP